VPRKKEKYVFQTESLASAVKINTEKRRDRVTEKRSGEEKITSEGLSARTIKGETKEELWGKENQS